MLKLSNNKKPLLEAAVFSKIAQWKSDLESEDKLTRAKAWAALEKDTTLFANFFFSDPKYPHRRFVPYAWQNAVFEDESKRILMCTSRQIGKTTTAALKALHYAYFKKNCLVLIASQTFPQAIEFMEKIKSLMRSATKLKWQVLQVDERESKAVIKLSNPYTKGEPRTYSRIMAVVAKAARGYTPDMVIPDELAYWEDAEKVFNEIIEPTIFSTKGPIFALSTPNGAQGIFYNLFKDKYWNSYQFDWRAHPHKTEEHMKPLKSRLTLLEFSSFYEAEFVSPKNAYFLKTEIDRAISGFEYKLSSSLVGIGVDIGKHHDYAVIFVGCIDDPLSDRKDAVVRVLERIVKPLGTKYASIVQEVKALHAKYKASIICVDATGSGEGPGEALELEGLPVELVKFSIQKKALVYGALKMLMEDPIGRIKIPDERELKNQLGWMMYEYTSSENIKIYPPDGSHDDEADALALMAYGLTNFMSAPASIEIVEKSPIPEPKEEKKITGKKLMYCGSCNDYHWDKICEEPLFISTPKIV